MPPISRVADCQGQQAPSQLEQLVAWRALQLKALHRLRRYLAARMDETGGHAAACPLLPHEPCASPGMARRYRCMTGDVIVVLDTRFLDLTELAVLARLQASPSEVDHASAALLRRRVAERIDELNQLNRSSLEALRVLAACRQGHARPHSTGTVSQAFSSSLRRCAL